MGEMKKINVITLGCSKNVVDSEHLMAQLAAAGYEVVFDSESTDAKVVVINTCGFIGDAKKESIDTILAAVRAKEEGLIERLFVIGCLSERYADELREEIPEVDEYFGVNDWADIVAALGGEHKAELATERVLTTPQHYAYLKIAEGCNRYCSYCAIPLITGKFTSRPKDEILDEVKWLVGEGVKEFNVIAQDLSSYGLDLYGEHRLAELVDEMAQIEGVEWIRLHYTYPTDFPYDLLPVMAKHKNVCKYMDIALQHCSDNMLKKMHRHITREEQDAVIARIRKEVPGICIRTTLLVGHPGETEEDFNELCEWVKEMKFERLGAFAYSEEEGTFAAKHYKDDIPQEEKERRVDTLMAIQQSISSEILSQMVGTKQRVVIDREEEEYYVGRTQYDSPEVDCEVLIEKEAKGERLEAGNYYEVTIIKSEDFDLYAQL